MTTAVATVSAVSATAALAVSSTSSAKGSATAAAFRFRTRFIHIQRPSAELSAVQRCDRPLRFCFVRHFNKCKSTGPARIAIRLNADPLNLTVRFK
jgi:hypothetical protein